MKQNFKYIISLISLSIFILLAIASTEESQPVYSNSGNDISCFPSRWAGGIEEVTNFDLNNSTLIVDYYSDKTWSLEEDLITLAYDVCIKCFPTIKNLKINYGLVQFKETVIVDQYSDTKEDLYYYVPLGTWSPDIQELRKYETARDAEKYFEKDELDEIHEIMTSCDYSDNCVTITPGVFIKTNGTDLQDK